MLSSPKGQLSHPKGQFRLPATEFVGEVQFGDSGWRFASEDTGMYLSTSSQMFAKVGGSSVFRFKSSDLQNDIPLNIIGAKLFVQRITSTPVTVSNAGPFVLLASGSGTANLPASNTADRLFVIYNDSGANRTIGRNGNTIDGVAADLTLADQAGALVVWNATDSDWKVVLSS